MTFKVNEGQIYKKLKNISGTKVCGLDRKLYGF